MKTNAYRKASYFAFMFVIAFFISCKKENINSTPPTIEFISGVGFCYSDTASIAASSVVFMVKCTGENALTNFIVKKNGVRIIDEGINQQTFTKEVTVVKSSEPEENIEFTIRDIAGNSSSISVTITLDTSTPAGSVIRFANITLNAQNAAGGKGFVSLFNGTPVTLQEAFSIQANIHLLYYFDLQTTDTHTIASPGANIDNSVFSGSYGLANWSTKNTTRFHQITMSLEEFEAINSPITLVDSYSEAYGKRKAKNLEAGNTFSFKVESTNKYGIIRVSDIIGEDLGSVTFSVVVQE